MTTAAQLIESLKLYCDANETIVFQYLQRQHVDEDMSVEDWDERARLVDKTDMADEVGGMMRAYIFSVGEDE